MNANKGFTLMELMVTLAVASIVLTIGIPSFRDFIQQNRIATTANAYVTALNLARSEAIRRGTRVTVCKSANGTDCVTAGDWTQGWAVFADPDNDAVHDNGEPLIQTYRQLDDGLTLCGNANVADYVSFVARGHSEMTGGAFQVGTVRLHDGDIGRDIVLGGAGRVRVQDGGVVCPP